MRACAAASFPCVLYLALVFARARARARAFFYYCPWCFQNFKLEKLLRRIQRIAGLQVSAFLSKTAIFARGAAHWRCSSKSDQKVTLGQHHGLWNLIRNHEKTTFTQVLRQNTLLSTIFSAACGHLRVAARRWHVAHCLLYFLLGTRVPGCVIHTSRLQVCLYKYSK